MYFHLMHPGIKREDLGWEARKFERDKRSVATLNAPPVEETIRELVEMFHKEKPELSKTELVQIVNSATKYAKELLKGKAAELYGLSLTWAVEALKDPDVPVGIKKDVVLKVLGHMLPTQISLVGDEENKPVMFAMARPTTEPENIKYDEDDVTERRDVGSQGDGSQDSFSEGSEEDHEAS